MEAKENEVTGSVKSCCQDKYTEITIGLCAVDFDKSGFAGLVWDQVLF